MVNREGNHFIPKLTTVVLPAEENLYRLYSITQNSGLNRFYMYRNLLLTNSIRFRYVYFSYQFFGSYSLIFIIHLNAYVLLLLFLHICMSILTTLTRCL